MTAKQYLKRLRFVDKRVESKMHELQTLRSQAERTTTIMSNAPGGHGQEDRTAATVAKIVDLEAELLTAIGELIDLKAEAIRLIRAVENEDCQLVLFNRYINMLTWEQIAVNLPCSYRTALYIHGRALREFEDVLQQEKFA